jgi:CheY-like chemotaxis protein
LFYQVDYNLDRADGGLGVGLSLVRTLIELHGGTVQARSPGRGQGSEFVIRLPCLNEDFASPRQPELPSNEIPPTRILVVDDNLDSAKSMALLLKLMGHEVCLAHDGLEAVEVAVRERPEVIMLDIGLPGQDGYQACRLIRREGLDDELIVALTGYGQDEDRARSMAAGFNNHLVKPVSLEMIQELLTDYAQRRKRPQ